MNVYRIALIILLAFCIQEAKSQDLLPDSIKQELRNHVDDLAKVQYLQRISGNVFRDKNILRLPREAEASDQKSED